MNFTKENGIDGSIGNQIQYFLTTIIFLKVLAMQ